MYPWQTIGILGLAARAECRVLAVVFQRVGTRGSVARKFALLLVAEGPAPATAAYPEPTFNLEMVELSDRYPLYDPVVFALHTFGDCVMLALQTKLTRPLAGRQAIIGVRVKTHIWPRDKSWGSE